MSNLMPSLTALTSTDFSNSEVLTAWIVFILLAVFAISVCYLMSSFIKAYLSISLLQRALKDLSPSQVAANRRNILEELQSSKRLHATWEAFDHYLIEHDEPSKVFSPYGAHYFFNNTTLSAGIADNKFLLGVSSFLTAIGVIGTFVGLQIGLSSLAPTSEGAPSADVLREGIFGMIGGASVAFMTSVWGLVTSLAFNMLEKFVSSTLKGMISRLQSRIDILIPIATTASSLSIIATNTQNTAEKVALLDEKIADRLQTVMETTTASISQGISNVLGPAMEQLNQTATNGSTQVMEALVGQFMDSASSAGEQQREMMNLATSQMASVTSGLNESLSATVDSFMGQINQLSATFKDQNAEAINSLIDAVNAQKEDATKRQEQLITATSKIIDGQHDLTSRIDSILTAHNASAGDVISAMSNVVRDFQNTSESNSETIQSQRQLNEQFKDTLAAIGTLTQTLETASSLLGSSLIEASQTVSTAATTLTANSESTVKLAANVDLVSEHVRNSANTFLESAQISRDVLEKLQGQYQTLSESLSTYTEQLESHIGKVMNQYMGEVDDQTNERMSAWITQTNQYTAIMGDVVRALSGVVDDIEGKIHVSPSTQFAASNS